MFPIRDDNPQVLTPYVTYALVAINAAAWFLVQGFGMEPQLSQSVCQFGLIPAELLQNAGGQSQVQLGPQMVCNLNDSSGWLSTFTSMFMHGSWLHIIGNMWFLWIFGDNVEDSMGHLRFAVFYVLCGFAAAALQVASNPESTIPMVGASGAIGGVMGAYVLLYPKVQVHLLVVLGFLITRVAVPAVLMLGYWFVLQLFSGFTASQEGGGVAFWAHVGGFVAGAVLVLLFKDKDLLAKHPYHGWNGRSPRRNWERFR